MKVSRIQTLSLRRKTVRKDGEGVTTPVWGSATRIECETWPAGGQLQANTYGDRVNNMKNVKVKGSYTVIREENHEAYQFDNFTLCEGDGLCINVDASEDPDYKIVSITPYKPLKMEVERI